MTNPTNILRQVLFHPVGALAVEPFHDGDVRHGCGCRGAVPILLTRREPDHVTRPNLLDWASPALCQAAASRHDQGLAQRVGMPCSAGAGLKRNTQRPVIFSSFSGYRAL